MCARKTVTKLARDFFFFFFIARRSPRLLINWLSYFLLDKVKLIYKYIVYDTHFNISHVIPWIIAFWKPVKYTSMYLKDKGRCMTWTQARHNSAGSQLRSIGKIKNLFPFQFFYQNLLRISDGWGRYPIWR